MTVSITEIIIYPIKSTAGIPVDACAVHAQGLAMDRRWMVVDEDGGFLSGREFPALTQIRTQLEYGGVFFGQNLIPRASGTVRVGDVVTVHEHSNEPLSRDHP